MLTVASRIFRAVVLIPIQSTLLLSWPSIAISTGIYNSSFTPSSLPWNTYNYCNAPHVDGKHYNVPPDAELVYLNLFMRHHKRTPDNLFPAENSLNPAQGWDCSDFLQLNYAAGTSPVYHEVEVPEWHPFRQLIWNGTCDAGQLTRAGLEDAIQHGKDFWDVYHGQLHFLSHVNNQEIYVRTSTETRTHQVAGGLLYGMDPSSHKGTFPLHTQPSNIDSLVPRYSCPHADSIRNNYQSIPAWTDHLQSNADLKNRLDRILGTGGLSGWSSWYDHFFDALASRTCHGQPLPCNATTGECVTQQDVERVFALGDYEYNYIWNAAENSSGYVKLTFGVMFAEIAHNFAAFRRGEEHFKARLYVGHDGTMIRLAAGLGFGSKTPLRWPAMGSEVVIETWKKSAGGELFIRVLHEGTPVSGPLGWLPLEDFLALLEEQVPEDIFTQCMSA